ncbi:MAG: SURF1 family protein [Cognatishimia sp.]
MRRLILPLTFGILGTAILLSLGSWQVRRLAEKENLLAQIDQQIAAEPVALPMELDSEADKFLAVTAEGQITEDEIHVLASTRDTGAIYRVIAAFETTEGRRILLDRGWVYPPDKDTKRPAVKTIVQGNLHWPQEVDSYTPENDMKANIWFARDVPTLAKELNTEEVLIVVRSTTEKDTLVTPLPVASAGIPNDHLQYAVTWYGLAAVWVMMTLYYLRRMRKQQKV